MFGTFDEFQMCFFGLVHLLSFFRLEGDQKIIGEGIVYHIPDSFRCSADIIGFGVLGILEELFEGRFKLGPVFGLIRVVQPEVNTVNKGGI